MDVEVVTLSVTEQDGATRFYVTLGFKEIPDSQTNPMRNLSLGTFYAENDNFERVKIRL